MHFPLITSRSGNAPASEEEAQPTEAPQFQRTKEEPKSEDEGSSQEQLNVEPKGEPKEQGA